MIAYIYNIPFSLHNGGNLADLSKQIQAQKNIVH